MRNTCEAQRINGFKFRHDIELPIASEGMQVVKVDGKPELIAARNSEPLFKNSQFTHPELREICQIVQKNKAQKNVVFDATIKP